MPTWPTGSCSSAGARQSAGARSGLEVFDEAVGFYGHCQQDDRIEAFNVILLEPHGGSVKAFGDSSGALGDLPGRRTYVHATRE